MRCGLIAIALAVLALAGLRPDDTRAIAPLAADSATSQLASQPAPDAEAPAIVRAAVTSPANAQTQLACGTRGASHPVRDVWTIACQTSLVPRYDVSRPRTFPLLI